MKLAHVRAVQASDLPRLIELCKAHATFEHMAIEPPSASSLNTALFVQPARLHAFVAEYEDELVGYATATIEFSTWSAREFMHMDCLYVRDENRGHGIGRLLLDALVAQAAALNIVEMQWQTPDWNVAAQRFYARLGASAANKVRFTLRQPAYK